MFRGLVLLLVWQSAAEDVDITIPTATPSFTVRGEAHGDVNHFYGIPFSKPRTPPNRFALPEEYEHAAGSTYIAKDQKDECVQSSGVGSEDCLYLDVYMPASANPTNQKHVLVWIFGGAWQTGSKNDYSGVLWASQQWTDEVDRILVVTVNYRMNILGYPDMDGVHKNLGMHDNIVALQWVNDHISNFGGDASHITIFGESAGSMNVLQLWASPAARGLFDRAIAQSPYMWYYPYGTPVPNKAMWESKRAQQLTCLQDAQAIACASLPGGVNDSSCTFQTPTLHDLANVTKCFGRWYGPMSEDGVISHTFHKDMCGSVDMGFGVPLLVGHNALEINLWTIMGALPTKDEQMHEWIDYLAPLTNTTSVWNCLGDLYEASGRMQTPPKPAAFGATSQEQAKDIYATFGVFFNIVSQTLMELPNVHMFVFNESANHNGDFGGGYLCQNPLGAHTCEVPFVVSQLTTYNLSGANVAGGAPMDTVVQRNMRKVWANFAVSANPGWAHDEIGVFMDNETVIRTNGAAFIPEANTLLTKLMCHPATITPTCPMPETHTCGDVKSLYRRNRCCGNPGKTFDF